jgi:hypothetical protein
LYINSLAGSKFIRSSEIFYDFLSLLQQEFNKKKNDYFDKLKTPVENLNEEIKKRSNLFDKVFNCLNLII